MRLSFAPAALRDLRELREYIARDKPKAASQIAAKLVAATDRLLDHPRIGRPGAVTGTLELVIKPYVIVYQVRDSDVTVLRVWHSRQNRPGR